MSISACLFPISTGSPLKAKPSYSVTLSKLVVFIPEGLYFNSQCVSNFLSFLHEVLLQAIQALSVHLVPEFEFLPSLSIVPSVQSVAKIGIFHM